MWRNFVAYNLEEKKFSSRRILWDNDSIFWIYKFFVNKQLYVIQIYLYWNGQCCCYTERICFSFLSCVDCWECLWAEKSTAIIELLQTKAWIQFEPSHWNANSYKLVWKRSLWWCCLTSNMTNVFYFSFHIRFFFLLHCLRLIIDGMSALGGCEPTNEYASDLQIRKSWYFERDERTLAKWYETHTHTLNM